jgi:hypothetical protein
MNNDDGKELKVELNEEKLEYLIRGLLVHFRYLRDFYLMAKSNEATPEQVEEYYEEFMSFYEPFMLEINTTIIDQIGLENIRKIFKNADS